MSRVLPILFNTEMVRAILDGRKTVTRRIIKQEKYLGVLQSPSRKRNPDIPDEYYIERLVKPQCEVGDVLYVRETWTKLYYVDPDGYTHYDQKMYFYAADGVPDISLVDADGLEEDDQRIRWRPSIHMPKDAARIWLKVTDVRVERLQEIDGRGILAEGIVNGKSNPANGKRWENMQRIAFSEVWNSTIMKADRDRYGWNANPWVWVIEFERCGRPEEG